MNFMSAPKQFGGLRIKTFQAGQGLGDNPGQFAWRIPRQMGRGQYTGNAGCGIALLAGGAAYFAWRSVWLALGVIAGLSLLLEAARDRYNLRRLRAQALEADPRESSLRPPDARLRQLQKRPVAGRELAALALDPAAAGVTALIFDDIVDGRSVKALNPLLLASHRLPALEHLCLGDIPLVETELNWLALPHDDLSELLAAFPQLRELRIYGRFAISPCAHGQLRGFVNRSLELTSSGVRGLLDCDLPQLEELELWTGDPTYWDTDLDLEDFQRLWTAPFPRLRRLGLCNSMLTDDLVAELVKSPLLGQLEELDLSLGTLSDEGARLLLECPAVRNLRRLDLRHHFVSSDLVAQLDSLPLDVLVDEGIEPGPSMRDEEGRPIRYCAVQE